MDEQQSWTTTGAKAVWITCTRLFAPTVVEGKPVVGHWLIFTTSWTSRHTMTSSCGNRSILSGSLPKSAVSALGGAGARAGDSSNCPHAQQLLLPLLLGYKRVNQSVTQSPSTKVGEGMNCAPKEEEPLAPTEEGVSARSTLLWFAHPAALEHGHTHTHTHTHTRIHTRIYTHTLTETHCLTCGHTHMLLFTHMQRWSFVFFVTAKK